VIVVVAPYFQMVGKHLTSSTFIIAKDWKVDVDFSNIIG